VRILANTASGFTVIAALEAVVGAGAAKRRGAADRRVTAFDSFRFAGTVVEALVKEIFGLNTGVAVCTREAVGDTAAAVRKPRRGGAIVLSAGIGRLAAVAA
jgi:hypothetical protein